MTADQLRAIEGMVEMCESAPFRQLMAYMRDECPYVNGMDIPETAIIRNEGRLQGWLGCLRVMGGIHRAAKKPEPTGENPPLYPDPSKFNQQANNP